jgi:hypothetical protein
VSYATGIRPQHRQPESSRAAQTLRQSTADTGVGRYICGVGRYGGFRTRLTLGCLLLAAVAVTRPAAAQASAEGGGQATPPPQTQRADDSAAASEPVASRASGPHRERRGPRRLEELGQHLFRPSPEDQGPLRPGEEDELLAFAQEHAPWLYGVMSTLKQRNPQRLRERLSEFAPRLRHLRRVYAESPRLGAIVQAYAANLFEVQRGVRALRQAPADSASHASDRQELRKLVAENVRLESDALDALAAEVEDHRAERVADRMSYLLGDDADLAAEPERLRELVAAVRAAGDDAERKRARNQLREAVGHEVALEIRALRERSARRRQDVTVEVDRRMQRLLAERGAETQPTSRP